MYSRKKTTLQQTAMRVQKKNNKRVYLKSRIFGSKSKVLKNVHTGVNCPRLVHITKALQLFLINALILNRVG